MMEVYPGSQTSLLSLVGFASSGFAVQAGHKMGDLLDGQTNVLNVVATQFFFSKSILREFARILLLALDCIIFG